MTKMTFGFAAILTAILSLSAIAPSQAGGSQSDCWSYYNDAWNKMQKGNHQGYTNQMRKFNACMNQAWEGPVPKKRKHS